MSKYHEKCTDNPNPPTNAPRNNRLTSKPFCDCRCCTCDDCPDILKMLSITLTDSACRFGSKVTSDDTSEGSTEKIELTNLLDVLNQNRDCNCEVVARGVREHVHKNIGMTARRDNITDYKDVFNQLPATSPKEHKSVTIKDKKNLSIKDSKDSKTTPKTSKHRLCENP